MDDSVEQAQKAVERVTQGLGRFVADMQAADIHVGLGAVPRCVNCGELWPCARSSVEARYWLQHNE